MPENKLQHYLLLHLIVFIWGFTAILGALISLEAIPLVFFRLGLAVLFIFIFFLIQKKSFFVDKQVIIKFLITGIIVACHWIFFFKAIKVSNVSVALVTMSTGAFFTSIVEPIFFKRKINLLEIILGFLVIVGLYIIFNFESQYQLGIFYALISSFLGSLFAVFNGLFAKKYDASSIAFYQLSFGTVFVAIYLFFSGGFVATFFEIAAMDWVYLAILSSVCTAFAFISSVRVMKFVSPYTVMLTVNLEPIYAIILALLIFGEKEKMNPEFYFGAFIVFVVVIANGIIKNKATIWQRFQHRINSKK